MFPSDRDRAEPLLNPNGHHYPETSNNPGENRFLRGHWEFGKPASKKKKPTPFTTFAYGHPRRGTIDLLALAIPLTREPATKQVVFDAVMRKPPYAEFRKPTIRKAIYATAWDGTIEIQAYMNRHYEVKP